MLRLAGLVEGATVCLFPEKADPMSSSSNAARAAKAGISFGTALAIVISWHQYQSLLWAVIHGLFSWLYVVYFALTRV